MIVLWYRTMIGTYLTISLCFSARSQGYDTVPLSLYTIEGVNCVSLQFGSFMSIYTSVGKVVSLNNLGWYLCITAIWRYGVLWYWWYVPWLVSKISRSLCKSGYGNIVSLHNPGGELCLPIYTIQGSKKLSSHRSSVSRHVLIDYFYWYFLCTWNLCIPNLGCLTA